MRTLARVAIATLMTLPLWAPLWAQDKPAPPPPKPPAEAPKTPPAKPAEPPKSGEDPIDKRRDRMKQRDGEIDKILKQKGKK